MAYTKEGGLNVGIDKMGRLKKGELKVGYTKECVLRVEKGEREGIRMRKAEG